MRINHQPRSGETFLPKRVVRAADRAMLEVLEEDRLLRVHGIMSPNGRTS